MSDLRKALIHLAQEKPELRPQLLPLLREAAGSKPSITEIKRWVGNLLQEMGKVGYDLTADQQSDLMDVLLGARPGGLPLMRFRSGNYALIVRKDKGVILVDTLTHIQHSLSSVLPGMVPNYVEEETRKKIYNVYLASGGDPQVVLRMIHAVTRNRDWKADPVG